MDTFKFEEIVINFSIHFDDTANQRNLNTLIKEVQATNPSFQACQIRDGNVTVCIT